VAAKDFTGRDANGVGLVRRIENMVNEIPAYCGELQHRQDFARTRTEELLAVADTPFEHEADLVGKEHELPAGSRCTTGPPQGIGTTSISWPPWSEKTGGAST